MFGKNNTKGADELAVSPLQPRSPASSPHTPWTWYRIPVWSQRQRQGAAGRGSFVLSAYWKCTVGCFPVWETVSAKLFLISHIYLIWLAASASSFVSLLFASCTKRNFFFFFLSQSLKTELTWQGGCVFGLNFLLSLCVILMPYLLCFFFNERNTNNNKS